MYMYKYVTLNDTDVQSREVRLLNDVLATKLVHGNPGLSFLALQFDVAVQMQTEDIFLLLKTSAVNTLEVTYVTVTGSFNHHLQCTSYTCINAKNT